MKNLDWSQLSFGYTKADYNVRCYYKDGKWSAPEVSDSEMLSIHMSSTCLHYGQEAFEGMKAFRGKDGKIRLFRVNRCHDGIAPVTIRLIGDARRIQLALHKRCGAVKIPSEFRIHVQFTSDTDELFLTNRRDGVVHMHFLFSMRLRNYSACMSEYPCRIILVGTKSRQQLLPLPKRFPIFCIFVPAAGHFA